MARPKRGHIHAIDKSWMKYRNCGWCGKPMCVNNYEDRRTRLKKYKGRLICPWCERFVKMSMIQELIKIGEDLERVGCLKELAKTGKPAIGKKGQLVREGLAFKSSCDCAACRANRLLDTPWEQMVKRLQNGS